MGEEEFGKVLQFVVLRIFIPFVAIVFVFLTFDKVEKQNDRIGRLIYKVSNIEHYIEKHYIFLYEKLEEISKQTAHECYGIKCWDLKACSGHGKCNSTGLCECNEGHFGKECEYSWKDFGEKGWKFLDSAKGEWTKLDPMPSKKQSTIIESLTYIINELAEAGHSRDDILYIINMFAKVDDDVRNVLHNHFKHFHQ